MKGVNEQIKSMGIKNEDRTPCEVWTRVMGYHRPVACFNPGKQGEHAERRFFSEPTYTEESWENGKRMTT